MMQSCASRPEPALHSRTPASSGRAIEPAGTLHARDRTTRLIRRRGDHHGRAAAASHIDRRRPIARRASTRTASNSRPRRRADVWRCGVTVEPHVTPSETVGVCPCIALLEREAIAPTFSSSDAPQPRRIERERSLALRLAASPQRLPARLQALEAESLQHGKYDVFHRLDEHGASIIFSVASMVEPGTFDLAKMAAKHFPASRCSPSCPVRRRHARVQRTDCVRTSASASAGGTLQDDAACRSRCIASSESARKFETSSGRRARASARAGRLRTVRTPEASRRWLCRAVAAARVRRAAQSSSIITTTSITSSTIPKSRTPSTIG